MERVEGIGASPAPKLAGPVGHPRYKHDVCHVYGQRSLRFPLSAQKALPYTTSKSCHGTMLFH